MRRQQAPAEVTLAGSTEGSGRADASGEGAEVVGSMGGTAASESSLPRVLNLVPLPAGWVLGDRGAGVDTRSSATLTKSGHEHRSRECVWSAWSTRVAVPSGFKYL